MIKILSSVIVITAWWFAWIHYHVLDNRIRREGLFDKNDHTYGILHSKRYPAKRRLLILIWVSFSFLFIKYWHGIALGATMSTFVILDNIPTLKNMKKERERKILDESHQEEHEDSSEVCASAENEEPISKNEGP